MLKSAELQARRLLTPELPMLHQSKLWDLFR
jgi:hypothetical protein